MFLVFGFVHNIDNEPTCESLTRSDGSSFSFANKKTDKVSICDTDKIFLLCVVINESVTIKKPVERPGKLNHDASRFGAPSL